MEFDPADFDIASISKAFPQAILWKKDGNFRFTEISPTAGKLFGYQQAERAIGRRDEDLPCKIAECAALLQRQDQSVITANTEKKFLEILCAGNDEWKILHVTKRPCHMDANHYGTLGFAIDITNVAAALNIQLAPFKKSAGLSQSSYTIDSNYGELNLPPKQAECLFHLIRGKTTKEIAKIMQTSPRTTESHLVELKRKFECNRKSELIEKALSLGLNTIIPKWIFQKQISIVL